MSVSRKPLHELLLDEIESKLRVLNDPFENRILLDSTQKKIERLNYEVVFALRLLDSGSMKPEHMREVVARLQVMNFPEGFSVQSSVTKLETDAAILEAERAKQTTGTAEGITS